jgi:hypothetical protein
MSSSSGRNKSYPKYKDGDDGQGRPLLPPAPPAYSDVEAPDVGFHSDDHGSPPAYTPFPEDEKFDPAPRYTDVWATVLFILHLVAFFAVVGFCVPSIDFAGDPGSPNPPIPQGTFTVLMVAVAAGALASVAYFFMMMKFARSLIVAGFALNIVYNFSIAFMFMANGSFGAGALWLGLAFIFGMIWWSWRGRIPFATIMLESVVSILGQFPGTTFVAMLGLVVNVLWVGLWLVTLFGVIVKFSPNSVGNIETCDMMVQRMC